MMFPSMTAMGQKRSLVRRTERQPLVRLSAICGQPLKVPVPAHDYLLSQVQAG